ncbi:MAG TPA: MarR family winged helix-turn-helix transcriptional regulator [Pirellulaceae bacterium]|nr:MarR family winged helix-turn-helix transcriptional regulator [Pirellulaceae bacterium]
MTNQPAISRLDDHLGYWLRFVSNHVSQAFTRKVEARGVTVAEWVLMREMLRAGPTNPSELAAGLGLTRGAISKLIERLSRKQLVERSAGGEDRRYQQVALTPAGEQLVPALAQLADENDREFFGHLAPEDHARLIEQLQEIVRRHGWKELPTS